MPETADMQPPGLKIIGGKVELQELKQQFPERSFIVHNTDQVPDLSGPLNAPRIHAWSLEDLPDPDTVSSDWLHYMVGGRVNFCLKLDGKESSEASVSTMDRVTQWMDQLQRSPKIQEAKLGELRLSLICILIGDQQPSSLRDKLSEWSQKFSVFLMTPTLQAGEDNNVIESVNVWPLAVSQLLTGMGAHQDIGAAGLWAWRALNWLGQTPEVDPGALSPEDETRMNERHHFLDYLKKDIVSPKPNPWEPPTLKEDIKSSELISKISNSESNDISEAGIHLKHFTPESPDRPDFHQRYITVIDLPGIEKRFVEDGIEKRKNYTASTNRGSEDKSSVPTLKSELNSYSEVFHEITKRDAPEPDGSVGEKGGPFVLNRLALEYSSSLSRSDVMDRVSDLFDAWNNELRRGESDLYREMFGAREDCSELNLARRSMVAFWPRLWMGAFSTLIVVSVALQALRCWSGAVGLFSEKLGMLLSAKSTVMILIATTLGSMTGVMLPYFLEKWRGQSAGRFLFNEARDLSRARAASIDERRRMCMQAWKNRYELRRAGAFEWLRSISNRAYEVFQFFWNRSTDAHPAAHASSDVAERKAPAEASVNSDTARDIESFNRQTFEQELLQLRKVGSDPERFKTANPDQYQKIFNRSWCEYSSKPVEDPQKKHEHLEDAAQDRWLPIYLVKRNTYSMAEGLDQYLIQENASPTWQSRLRLICPESLETQSSLAMQKVDSQGRSDMAGFSALIEQSGAGTERFNFYSASREVDHLKKGPTSDWISNVKVAGAGGKSLAPWSPRDWIQWLQLEKIQLDESENCPSIQGVEWKEEGALNE